MTLTNFGNNFTIEEDSNGDYVVTYTPTSTVIERIDSGDEEKILEVGTRISDLVDNTSGNTVYDSSAQEFGDGNQDADLSDVTLADIIDTASGNTVYDSSTETIGDGNQDVSADDVQVKSVTGTSGAGVYDDSTQTVGDGTTSANHDSIDADTSLKLPTYSDNTNAVQENESLWYNDGTGPDASGYYAYDGGLIGPFGEGGEWQEDGSGNIVPIDGETIGDGTTSAEHESVNTDGADITGETFIRSTRGSDSASTTAATFVNAYDGELKDSIGELNSSGQLTPTETGEYQVLIGVDIRGNTVLGDKIAFRVRDVDRGSDLRLRNVEASDNNFQTAMPFFVEMTAGTTYELQVSNLDSSFVVTANRDTKGTIVRSIVHP